MALYTIDNKPGDIDFECGSDPVKRTLQNCKNLLMTRMGEVPYDRLRGFDASFYSLPLPLLNSRLIKQIDRVMLWEPDVDVVSAAATMNERGETVITVTVDVKV